MVFIKEEEQCRDKLLVKSHRDTGVGNLKFIHRGLNLYTLVVFTL